MTRIRKSIYIQAPVEEVFSYVADPVNRPQLWPCLIQLTDIEPLPGGGHKLKWVYKIAGVRVKGIGETIKHVPGRLTVDSNRGGVSSVVAWRCTPERGGTRFTFDYKYRVHEPFLKRRSAPFLFKINECQVEMLVANVKAGIEARCSHHSEPSPV